MKKLLRITGVLGLAFAMSLPQMAMADAKPKGAKVTDNSTVANFYAGTTRIWKSCNGGGIYFDAGWEAKAYCNKNQPSVGWGKWSVKGGKICHEVIWRWMENGALKTHEGKKDCIAHVTDAEGQIWRRWNDDKDWWRVQDIKSDKNAASGFKFKSKFTRTRKKKGV